MRLLPGMKANSLSDATWECMATPAGSIAAPAGLSDFTARWLPASVPGTAADAVRRADGVEAALGTDYDGQDWWFRTSFEGGEGPWELSFQGLATLADVWLNGEHVLHSENMFRRHGLEVDGLPVANELIIRFAALGVELSRRRPRPRWRSTLVREQNLRWFRTTLLGRMPGWAGFAAPVGPWRPIVAYRRDGFGVDDCDVVAAVDGTDGVVDVTLSLTLSESLAGAAGVLKLGNVETAITLQREISCRLRIPDVELWWPHTHGSPSLYPLSLRFGDDVYNLGAAGFRVVDVDLADDGFGFVVNGVPTFVRGACWVPPDVIGLNTSREQVYDAVRQLADAGLNMLRVTGTMVYENADFFDACDELGVLVWQDAMVATLDPPDDAGFEAEFEAEFREVCKGLRGRPSLAVICGGSESEQQPSFFGLPAAQRNIRLLDELIPRIAQEVLADVPYVRSSPTGGDLPTQLNQGVTQYFGVGAYLRPLTDVLRAGVRFAGECLAFSIVPEKATVDDAFVGPRVAGHDPLWKRAVPRDATASWDFEDVRDFYVREIFGVDPMLTRYADPGRALDFGRAAVAHAFETVFAHWRRSDSACNGALVLSARDLWPGAGWGLVDSLGRAKSPWYAMRRILAPVAVFVTDEGLDGVACHVMNDTGVARSGRLGADLYDLGGRRVVSAESRILVPARGSVKVSVASLIDGFRDVNHAYRFGPRTYEAITVTFTDDDTDLRPIDTVHVFDQTPDAMAEIGLTARATHDDVGWVLEIGTTHLARWVAIDVPGYQPDDSWFHLGPAGRRTVRLVAERGVSIKPRGYVRALNSRSEAAVRLDDELA
jgi:beta-mannosidase